MSYAIRCAVVNASSNWVADTADVDYVECMDAAEITTAYAELHRDGWLNRSSYMYAPDLDATVRKIMGLYQRA